MPVTVWCEAVFLRHVLKKNQPIPDDQLIERYGAWILVYYGCFSYDPKIT
jgi:hypothetical protein